MSNANQPCAASPTGGPGSGRQPQPGRLQIVRACLVTVVVLAALSTVVWLAGPDEAAPTELFGP